MWAANEARDEALPGGHLPARMVFIHSHALTHTFRQRNTHVFCLCKLGLVHSAGLMTINGEDVNLEPSRTMQCRPPVGGWHHTEPWVIPTEWSSHLLLFCIFFSFCDDKVVSVCTHKPTHTHTRVGFYGLQGLSIGVMVFILYKLYVLLPYTYPTPKLSPHRRRCISTFPPKNSLCMIYKRFELWGHWKCPHKSPSPCNTYVIHMSLYTFVST